MTATVSPRLVVVTRAQVRAARELLRMRGADRVHPVVRQVAALRRRVADEPPGRDT